MIISSGSKETNRIDSLLFDLDGTLWDASMSCAKAWNQALRTLGISEYFLDQAIIRSFSGLKIDTVLTKYFDFIPMEDHRKLFELYQINEKAVMRRWGGELYPHVKETLTALSKKYQLFIVSNCLAGYIQNFIQFHELQNLFTDVESSGKTGLPKSENLKLVITRNNLQNPVYIGDTRWDQEAALKANVSFIYASYGFGQIDNVDWEIGEFSDLEHLIIQLEAAGNSMQKKRG